MAIAEFGERVIYNERIQEGEVRNKGESDWEGGHMAWTSRPDKRDANSDRGRHSEDIRCQEGPSR